MSKKTWKGAGFGVIELKPLDEQAMGNRIRLVREAKGLTREQLAELVDVSTAFIADMEYGKKSPSVRTLFKLSQALGVTADYIIIGNIYDADGDDEASALCEEIASILKMCSSSRQLKSFRDISAIYVEALKAIV